MLVTSGPGATNAVTPLQDALMDSIPLVCLSGQVPTSLIGSDAFQECDTVGITRPCTKHNWLVKDVNELAGIIHEAFRIAQTGRPGPVVVDIPKDIQFATGTYTVRVDVPVIGDVGHVLEDMVRLWRALPKKPEKAQTADWWAQIERWRARNSFAYKNSNDVIMPQYALQRLYEASKGRDTYITTEVGQHQMWAAQFFGFEEPNHWMTSGGLGTMGYGLPAAIGVQVAHPEALVIDIAGDASIQMCIQEMSCAIQYGLPVKIFILNNQYMGMVRQWQQLLHGNRLSNSYTEAMPDFVKLAEAYGAVGMYCDDPRELDEKIAEMIAVNKPVIFDCRVANLANCFPMIPSGKAHNEMLLPDEATDEAVANAIDAKGRQLV